MMTLDSPTGTVPVRCAMAIFVTSRSEENTNLTQLASLKWGVRFYWYSRCKVKDSGGRDMVSGLEFGVKGEGVIVEV